MSDREEWPYDTDYTTDAGSYDDLFGDILDAIDPDDLRTDLYTRDERTERLLDGAEFTDPPETRYDIDPEELRYDQDALDETFQELYADAVYRSDQEPSDTGQLVWQDAAAGDAADFHHQEVEAAYRAGVDAPAVVLLSTFFESYVTAQVEQYLVTCTDERDEQVVRDLLGASTRYDSMEDGEELERAGFSDKIAAARSTGLVAEENAELFELVSWSRNRYTSDGLEYFDPDAETPLQQHEQYGLDDAIELYESILGLDAEESMLDLPRMEPDAETAAELHETTMDVLIGEGHQGAATVLLAAYFESAVTDRLEEYWAIDDPAAGTAATASMPFEAKIEQARNAALDPDREFELLAEPDAMHPVRIHQVMTETKAERNRFGHSLAAYAPESDAGIDEALFDDAQRLYELLKD